MNKEFVNDKTIKKRIIIQAIESIFSLPQRQLLILLDLWMFLFIFLSSSFMPLKCHVIESRHNNIQIQTLFIKEMKGNKTYDSIVGINREYLAIILMTVGSVCSTTGYVYANEGKYHPFTTITIRGVVALVITYLISLKQKQDLTFASHFNFKWLLVNSITVLISALVYAWCQFYLPQPIAIAINSTSPIFVALFDKIFNDVSMTKSQVYWLIITFIGVLLVANGAQISAIFNSTKQQGSSKFENYLSNDPTVVLCVSIILIIVIAIYSYGLLLIKKLRNSTCLEIMYFQNIVFLFGTAVLLPIGLQDQNFYKPDFSNILKLIVFTCIPLSIGQIAVNQALLMTKNYSLVAPFMLSSILSGYLISVIRYGEEMNMICLAGTLSIVVGLTFMMRSKRPED